MEKILKKACKTSVLDLRDLEVISYFGSTGGSISSNFLVQSAHGPPFIIKVAPLSYKVWNKKKVVIDNSPLVELAILKLLNQEILKKRLTPCIPLLMGTQECNDISKVLTKDCKKFDLENPMSNIHLEMCLLQEELNRQLISPKFQVSAIEYAGVPCYIPFQDETIPVNDRDYYVICLLFQVVFTLAVIQRKFPNFRHNDLSNASNILLRNSSKEDQRTFDEYIVNNKVYPLSRAYQFVIIDYGLSSIKDKAPRNYEIVKSGPRFGALLTENRNQKRDLFDFINSIFRFYRVFSERSIQTTSEKLLDDIDKCEFGNEKNRVKSYVLEKWELPESNPIYKPLKTPEQFLRKFPWDKYIDKYVPKKYSVITEYTF